MKQTIIPLLLLPAIIAGLWFAIPSLHQQKAPIRIGSNNWPGYEFLYLASVKGFYQEEGVNVEIVQYGSLEDVRYGYEKAQIDVIASTIIELLMLKERTNKNPQVFLLADFSNGGDVLLAKKSIANLKDLKGKSIGVEPQSLGVFMLYRALEMAELKLSDVKIVGLDQGKMIEAMRSQTIQAAISYPPASIEIAKDENNHRIFDSASIPGEIIDIISADAEFITSRKDDFNAILRAWDKAVVYARNNPDEANAIMAKKEGITPKEFADALTGIDVLQIKEQAKYMREGGTVDKAITIANHILRSNGQLQKYHSPAALVYR